MFNEIKTEAQTRMEKSATALKNELVKIRTGRAHPNLLEHIMVPYYGADTPLSQVATINVADARTLAVTPWEKAMVKDIDKAIRTADLGLNPATSGDVIRVPLPALTEERRKQLTKVVRNEGENTKIAIRNIRRDANSQLKELLKAKEISEDDERRHQDEIQKLTDAQIKAVDVVLSHKETELMEI